MPNYEVLEPGFYNGKLYDPSGKRRIVTTDKPLNPVPKWLKAVKVKAETAAEKEQRLKDDASAAELDDENKRAVAAVTFQNPPSLSNSVETL